MRSEIQSAESVGYLWCDLSLRFRCHYDPEFSEEQKSPKLINAICLYAIWCTRSKSYKTQEPPRIEFYEYLPSFAFECTGLIYKTILRDLIANIGMTEIHKMGAVLRPPELKKFLADAQQAEDERQRRSRKR